jgi:FKBP-type peptidyl-prolyl cis-trans isomerase FkpA
MTNKALIALVAAVGFVAGCGGPQQPAPAPPQEQKTPPTGNVPPKADEAPPEAVKQAELPAPPPNTVGPAGTPPPAAAAAERKTVAAKTAPAKPAFTRTDTVVGTGREAQKGRRLSVNYTGWLYDNTSGDLKGRMFDTSKGRGPFDFVLGAGQVIPGWDQGFDGMKVGGHRRLIIPPDLAYGVDGAGGVIPPNATLVFEMELLDVQ